MADPLIRRVDRFDDLRVRYDALAAGCAHCEDARELRARRLHEGWCCCGHASPLEDAQAVQGGAGQFWVRRRR
ncbi:hypothetical protein ACFPRL_32520 [Pseudoclavibacter helvolus]